MILVLNCGSATLKYQLLDPAAPAARRGGLIEGTDYQQALRAAAADLGLASAGVRAVGHRVVHGGTRFSAPALIDDAVLTAIEELVPLAPLHNPANLAVIRGAMELLPDVPQVAVFDTAFHATLPAAAATYALDTALAGRHGIRRYGFHGTSHRFVATRTAALLGRPLPEVNTIVLHLGNGASATAVAGGRSVETSMGLSPLEGLVMGTRTGDIDPVLPVHLHRSGMSFAEIDEVLNRRGGLAGLCGDSDMRTVLARRAAGDPAARLAIDVYCHRLRKYVGAYAAVLGRLDVIAFTAGVGEHAAEIRAEALAGLEAFGIAVDPARNATGTGPRVISPDGAGVAVCVIPTDEELAIAEETAAVVDA